VIHISFDKVDYQGLGLSKALSNELSKCAKLYKIKLTETSLKSKFSELISELSEQFGKVVLLVDEYDKPIIDFLETEEIDQAKKNRLILRDFYSVLKSADDQLELIFITGISKFSKVSLFSHLNNLADITLTKHYAALTGYTQEELEFYFDDYLNACSENLKFSRTELLTQLKIWYDGYTWDGLTEVYNPFGILQFLLNQEFRNYWFSTGNPSFLIGQMRKIAFFNVENVLVNSRIFDKYDIENLELIPLLFQTGYLTIKKSDKMTGDVVLNYPNKEVKDSMYELLIDDIAKNPNRVHTGMTIKDLNSAFVANDLEKVKKILQSLLADLPTETYQNQSEGLFHGLIHLVFSYLGMLVHSEVHSSRGHADAVVQTLTDIYIFEFKFNKTAQEGLDQIKKQDYTGKYQASGKKITGIGVNFDSKIKGISEWLVEFYN
jgi:hypothetical protein